MKRTSVRYRVAECPLGHLLVAGTARGVCSVRLGDDPHRVVEDLAAETAAGVEQDAGGLDAWAEALLRYLRGDERELAIPLDVEGTEFQRRVWAAIRAIPYGATRSYSEIARALERPRAARAVARACASNPVPLLIPCHRVVTRGGKPGGYRYGAARKRALLAAEQRSVGSPSAPRDQSASATAIPY